MAYVTKTQVKKYLGINWTSGLDTFIDSLIAGAEKYIEKTTGRIFEAPDPDSDVTRYYNGNDDTTLNIHDLRSLTSVTVDGVALTVNTDFFLYPLNAVSDNEPYTKIELIQPETRLLNSNPRVVRGTPYVFIQAQRNVVIVGKWGYSATAPEDIQIATMKLVGAVIKENIGDKDLREVTSESIGEYNVTYSALKNIANAIGVDALLQGYVNPIKNKIFGGYITVS